MPVINKKENGEIDIKTEDPTEADKSGSRLKKILQNLNMQDYKLSDQFKKWDTSGDGF